VREWKPETAAQVRERIWEVIELAGHDVLDLLRSRAVEQEVLDVLDELAQVRSGWQTWALHLVLIGGTRPVVIVSRQDPDPPRALVLYVPLTTQLISIGTRWPTCKGSGRYRS
jgi:hypothetical protein